MKILRIALIAFLLSATFAACKKDNNDSLSAPGFEGKWVGDYGFGNDTPDIYFSLRIKPGGVIQELNSSGAAKGEGSWMLQGNTLKGTYNMLFSPYNEYSVIVTIDGSGAMVGTWGFDKNGSDGGKVSMTKAN